MKIGAINQLLTIRNWAIGCYIVEYEQEGCDCAKYGARLLQKLANELSIKGLEMPIEDPVERFFYELECIKGTWNVRELRRGNHGPFAKVPVGDGTIKKLLYSQ